MNDVPLIQKADINSINTSIIAIKKQLKQLTEAVGLIDVPDMPDLSPFVKKTDVADVVEADNMNPVTSNAVAGLFYTITTTTNNDATVKYVDMPNGFTESNCFPIGAKLSYNSSLKYCVDIGIQILMTNNGTNKIGVVVSNTGFRNKSIDIILVKK